MTEFPVFSLFIRELMNTLQSPGFNPGSFIPTLKALFRSS